MGRGTRHRVYRRAAGAGVKEILRICPQVQGRGVVAEQTHGELLSLDVVMLCLSPERSAFLLAQAGGSLGFMDRRPGTRRNHTTALRSYREPVADRRVLSPSSITSPLLGLTAGVNKATSFFFFYEGVNLEQFPWRHDVRACLAACWEAGNWGAAGGKVPRGDASGPPALVLGLFPCWGSGAKRAWIKSTGTKPQRGSRALVPCAALQGLMRQTHKMLLACSTATATSCRAGEHSSLHHPTLLWRRLTRKLLCLPGVSCRAGAVTPASQSQPEGLSAIRV